MNRSVSFLGVAILAAAMSSCQPSGVKDRDWDRYCASTDSTINVVVEIPAGTNREIRLREPAGKGAAGSDSTLVFLPYPANFGFIPSTWQDPHRGGSGEPLDVLLLAGHLSSGMVIPALPVGALLLRKEDRLKVNLIAVPADTGLQVMPIRRFSDLMLHFDSACRILEDWSRYRYQAEWSAWRDEQYAWALIRKWRIKDQ